MQIKQEKYNLSQSSIIRVTGSMQDIKTDVNLIPKITQPNIGSTISGIVTDMQNNPIKGAIVKLMSSNFEPLAHAATDMNGKYLIPMIPNSIIYNMAATFPGKLLTHIEPFSLSSGQSTVIDFKLYDDINITLGAISGNIFDLVGTDKRPVEGAIVSLYGIINNKKTLIAITYTDSLGVFAFSELSVGQYIIGISALGYLSSEMVVNVQSSKISYITNKLSVNPDTKNGVISGKILDANKLGIPNADVILYKVESNNELTPVAFTKTNSIGLYTFINVLEGTYLIKSNKSDLVSITSPTIPNNTSTLPSKPLSNLPIYFNMANETLFNGAKLDAENNFVSGIGGITDGSVTVNLITDSWGIYDLAVKYIGVDENIPFKLEVNGVSTGSIYIPPKTDGLDINNALTFSLPIKLNYGENTIKFHGNGNEYGPSFGEGSVTLIKMLTTYNYHVVDGDLSQGALIDNKANLVVFIGGVQDGASTVEVNIQQAGSYILSVNYRNSNRPMKIDINKINTGTVYSVTGENIGVFNTVIKLNEGVNTIKFYGDGVNFAPDLGAFTLEMITTSQSMETTFDYDIAQGTLENGAIFDNGTNLVGYIGGVSDGSSTIYVNMPKSSEYMLAIDYRNSQRYMKIDINGINTGTTYFVTGPNTGTFNVIVTLNEGINNIKFHGDGANYAPDLGKITIFNNFTVPTTSTLPNSIVNTDAPVINFEIKSGIVEKGANFNEESNYMTYIGGPNKGEISVPVNVSDSGSYTLTIKYRNSDRILNIDINGEYIDSYPILGEYTGTFSTVINLNSGNNTIRFYGMANNYAPDLGDFTLMLNPPMTSLIFSQDAYEAAQGIFSNGARVDDGINFAGWLGGPNDGAVTITITIEEEGDYNIAFKYIGADINRPLKIDINGVNTGTIYTPPMTTGWLEEDAKTFSVLTTLKSGDNTIMFHGNGIDYAPSIGLVTVTQDMPNNNIVTYNAANGILENGAQLEGEFNFAGWVGGPNDGSVTIVVTAVKQGLYNFDIQYISAEERPMKITINESDFEEIYYPPVSSSWFATGAAVFSLVLNLNEGDNTIKFHGNGVDYAPTLGLIIVSPLIAESTSTKLPEGSYYAGEGILLNGAKLDEGTNFAGWIGGFTDGSTIISVNAKFKGEYSLIIQYIAADKARPLKIDINGINTGEVYMPPKTNGWSIDSAKIFIVPIDLEIGGNTIKFHGNGIEYAPSIGIVTVVLASLEFSEKKLYNVASGTLENGAKILNNNFVGWLGGFRDGYSLVTVNVSSIGVYDIAFKYITSEIRSIKIDVNGKADNNVYTPPITPMWYLSQSLTFTIPVLLNAGDNTLKFHGNGTQYAPDLGTFTVGSTAIKTTLNYNTASGILENGALVDSNKFVSSLGGENNGAATVAINISKEGIYNLFIKYISPEKDRTFKVDINGINTGTIYEPPMTLGTTIYESKIFSFEISLNLGANIIKFYGDGKNYAPNLGPFSLRFISDLTAPTTIPTSTVPTSTIPTSTVPTNTIPTSTVPTSTLPAGNYNTALGVLSNGAKVDSKTGFVSNLGGVTDESVTVNVTVDKDASYKVTVQYLSGDTDRPLLYDVNGVNSGLVYIFPNTRNWEISSALTMTITVGLNKGDNKIKFHGDGTDLAPYLGIIKISSV
ncbi:carboxypeptidase regulatory-like domain-containing protein [Clostridium tarantellae]|uniref:CBM6 domain-containing protein n=1 Tax=Clostridium tarantellae TaxID=39493 RepID=A0A6I1MJD4_9CLOT|nr:carboxypeptidase regulatory-like domain-containing protein [Clostridium tarantellae]MPQ43200.1 hypothetical protein [Clostridium tarantellae]